MKPFYLHLSSNVFDIFGRNKIGNFVTRLKSTLRFEGDWEVALAEIQYIKSWFNINNDQEIGIIDANGEVYQPKSCFIKAGCYDKHDELIEMVNQKLKELVKHLLSTAQKQHLQTNVVPVVTPQITYDKFTRRITVIAGSVAEIELFPFFGDELTELFGLNLRKFNYITNSQRNENVSIMLREYKGDVEAFRSYDIEAGMNALWVYTDIIKPSFVGDTCARLLRVVQVPRLHFGERHYKIFEQPHYFPLNSDEFETIEIDIKDDTGETVQFKDGKVVVILHFRQNDI